MRGAAVGPFERECFSTVVEHTVCTCPVDGDDSVFAGADDVTGGICGGVDQVGGVEEELIASRIFKPPSGEVNIRSTRIHEFDPFTTGPWVVIVGRPGIGHHFGDQ